MNISMTGFKHFVAASALVAAGAGLPATLARADVVTDWNLTAQNIIAAKGSSPGVYFGMMHAAVYDAVNAIDGRYAVFAVQPTLNARGASKEAAAAAAAYRTLLGLYPDQQTTLDAAYATSLAAIADGFAKTRGIAIGEEVAAAWLAQRAGDGREASVPYVFGTEPGDYQRTPPAFPNPVTPWLAKMKPFTLTGPSQFRAYGPPDLTSERYALDLNTTKSLGALNSTERTAQETEIGLFYTETPTIYWGRNLRDFAATKRLGVAGNARLFAMLYVGLGDASIACFDSKYYFNRWRPVTAIPAADTDGNDATTADAAWAPLANTPPHPEYPAAHGCVTGQVAETLRRFFGTKYLKISLTSTVTNTTHTFYNTDDVVEEVIFGRVFGGMHFTTSVVHGAIIGRKVADWLADHNFQPVRHH
jgi:hypothetical protein